MKEDEKRSPDEYTLILHTITRQKTKDNIRSTNIYNNERQTVRRTD